MRSNSFDLNIIKHRHRSQRIRDFFYDFHRRYFNRDHLMQRVPYDILIPRMSAIMVWFYVVILELIAYNHTNKKSTRILNFLCRSSYQLKAFISIGYASGAAAYGASIEVYFLIPLLITNAILAIQNCSMNHGEVRATVIFTVASIALFLGTELAHQNFKCFTYQQSYTLNYLLATRAMIRPSIYLSVTMIFLASPGLRAIYNASRLKCLYIQPISTNTSFCNLIDMTQPAFQDNDSCVPDFATLMTSFEQLRIIRNIALCSIAFYSMYNKAFLDVTGIVSVTHKLTLHLFFLMSCSVIVVNIDPFQFKDYKIYFEFFEIIMFSTILILLIFNLRTNCKHRRRVIMEANPTIFG